MQLTKNDAVIPFETSDILGNTIRLSDFSGKKVMLSFYRFASCPLCSLRLNDIIRVFPVLKAHGLIKLAIFQSTVNNIEKYVCRQDPPFPIIADPERVLYDQYGVSSSWKGLIEGTFQKRLLTAMGKGFLPGVVDNDPAALPADFLINPDQTIYAAYYGKNISDHIPLDRIMDFIQKADMPHQAKTEKARPANMDTVTPD